MNSETRRALTDTCYRYALELRSRILRENPGIQQDDYQDEFMIHWIEYFDKILKEFGRYLNENDLNEYYDILRKIEKEMLDMSVF